jgi:hypothetical protein
MSDKTQLEMEIERQEMLKKSRGVFILVAILLICLVTAGAYTLKLRQDLSIKEKELSLTKYNCNNEKAEFSNKIKKLEEELEALGCVQPATDKPDTSNLIEPSGRKLKNLNEE